jgi:solute carrier family 35 (UDP-sugar transporter), member A1/2/3
MAKMKSNNSNDNFIKYLSLILLILQTTSLVLVMRYSRTNAVKSDDGTKDLRYLSSTAVVCSEIMKVVTCVLIIWYQSGKRF